MRWWVVVAVAALACVPSDRAVAMPGIGPGTSGVPRGWAAVPVSPGPRALGMPGGPGVPTRPIGGYRWPLAGTPQVTRPFDAPARPWLPGHRGVDLAADPGAVVFAAGPGVVAFAGSVGGTGVVSVDHADGLRTTYEPVIPLVAAGARVTSEQPIGDLLPGHDGCPVSACLHWGLRRGAEYLDPLLLFAAARMRLYPLRP